MISLVVSEDSTEFECDEFTIFDDDEEITQFSNLEREELQHNEVIQGQLETYDLLTIQIASISYLFIKTSYLYIIQC